MWKVRHAKTSIIQYSKKEGRLLFERGKKEELRLKAKHNTDLRMEKERNFRDFSSIYDTNLKSDNKIYEIFSFVLSQML